MYMANKSYMHTYLLVGTSYYKDIVIYVKYK